MARFRFHQLELFRTPSPSAPSSKPPQIVRQRKPVIVEGSTIDLDAAPDLEQCLPGLWSALATEYFPESRVLEEYEVVWSRRRQIRTLASCSLERKRIIVAKELKAEEHYRWLSPLLYHEMCHAYLGYTLPKRNGRTHWHGPEFRALEAQHPLIEPFNIWVNEGGWAKAVRSHRAKEAHARRKKTNARVSAVGQ